jgi:hypothetical protein
MVGTIYPDKPLKRGPQQKAKKKKEKDRKCNKPKNLRAAAVGSEQQLACSEEALSHVGQKPELGAPCHARCGW